MKPLKFIWNRIIFPLLTGNQRATLPGELITEVEKTSPMLGINLNDIVKGIIVAVLAGGLGVVYDSVNAGSLDFEWDSVKRAALLGGVAYLLKNLGTPSKQVLKMIVFFVLLSVSGFGQTNSTVKAIQSWNADSVTVRNLAKLDSTMARKTGWFYYNNQSQKWRVGTVKSTGITWSDLGGSGGGGGQTPLYFKNGLTKRPDSANVYLGGSLLRHTTITQNLKQMKFEGAEFVLKNGGLSNPSIGAGLTIMDSTANANGAVIDMWKYSDTPVINQRTFEMHSYANTTTNTKTQMFGLGVERVNLANNSARVLMNLRTAAGPLSTGVSLFSFLRAEPTSGTTTSLDVFLGDQNNSNSSSKLMFGNSSAGTVANAGIYVSNNANTPADAVTLFALGTNYTTVGGFRQDGAVLTSAANLSGGLSFVSQHASPSMQFYTGGNAAGNLRVEIGNTGRTTFSSNATVPGMNWGGVTADPSSLTDGDAWYRTDTDLYRVRSNGVTRSLVTDTDTQALTNKSVNGVTLSAAGAATSYLNATGSYSVPAGGISGTLVAGRVTLSNGTSSVTDDADFTFSGNTATIGIAGANRTVIQPNDVSVYDGATLGGSLYSSAGNAILEGNGNITVMGDPANGRVLLSPGTTGFIILSNLPTSCAGAPTGALANIAGVLNVCP